MSQSNPRRELPLEECNSREEIEAAARRKLRTWWSFDDGQQHTHTYHNREDFIENELPKLLARMEAIARNDAPLRGALEPWDTLRPKLALAAKEFGIRPLCDKVIISEAMAYRYFNGDCVPRYPVIQKMVAALAAQPTGEG